MSQQEFENYLALLTRLLRIDPRERVRVAEEFRSHMEDRLEELLARGLARDEAVRQALEEFGDAAGLAAQMVSLNRHRRNRWIMRLTTASVAAVVLIAAGIVTFWPGGNAGPGTAALVAQGPEKGDAGKQADPFAGGGDKPGGSAADEVQLADKLNRRTDAEFVETPFKDAVTFLAERTAIQIIIKTKRLEEAGVTVDQPVTLSLKNVRLSTLLDVMLEDLGLVYTEKDDLLVITTPDDAQATMEVRVYDCRDLLAMPAVSLPKGGPTMPGGYGGNRAGSPEAPTQPSGHPPTGSPPPRDPFAPHGDSSADASDDPLAAPRRPRNDVFPQAAGGFGGPAAGGQPGGGVGLGGMGMPGGPGGMMGGMGMGMGGSDMAGGGMRLQRPMTAEELKAEQLIHIITTAVNPDSWQEMGGPGTIGEYNGLIVVSQSARTHTKIEKVLDMLREAANLPRSNGAKVVR